MHRLTALDKLEERVETERKDICVIWIVRDAFEKVCQRFTENSDNVFHAKLFRNQWV